MIEMTLTATDGFTPEAQKTASERLASIPAATVDHVGVVVRTTPEHAPATWRALNELYDALYPLASGELILEAGRARR